ncbi:phage tail protein [Bacillus sp. CH30_1T]|uniref:phage tail protein n=1 Tax=Bacillus sp. CH30_1T TaxID=2604836 RepID=UPI00165E1AEE|nr:phage tail protein [Bacillus sp. CH30_1T]
MLIVTDLNGESESLTGFTKLKRKRRVNGERTIRFILFSLTQNEYAYPLVQQESLIELAGEEYRIKYVKEHMKGKVLIKEVEANHTFFDLINSRIYTKISGSKSLFEILNFIFKDTDYTFSIVESVPNKTWEEFGEDNRLSLLQDVLKSYSVEFERNGTHLTFKSEIGSKLDVQFRYSHNIKTISHEIDSNDLSTYIKGYGKDGFEVEYYSPLYENYDILHEAPEVRDERYTNADSLLERLKREINDTPNLSITVDYLDLRRNGYPYEVVNEGDYILLIHEPLNIDLDARIVEIEEEFNLMLEPINTKVTLSNYSSNTSDEFVNFSKTQKQVNSLFNGNAKLPYNVLDDAVKRSTEALQSAQTELEFVNGIIGRSKIDPNQLTILNSEGFGISKDGGQTFTEAITADGFNLSAGAIGTLDANNVTIFGGDATDYTRIEGSFLESRGQFTRTWQGNTYNHDVSLEFQNGYFAARSLNDDRNLYYSNFGISTFASGNQNESSGTIEFFSYDYHPTRKGLTISSVGGVVALRSGLERVIIDAYDHAYLRSNQQQVRIQPRSHVVGNNTFTFHVVDNAEANEQDGVLFFGSENNGTWSSGLRFSKILNGNTLYVTNGDGDRGTGNLEAFTIRANKSFIGALEAPTDNAYVQVNGALRVTDKNGFNNGSPNYRDVAARDLYVSDVEARDLRVKSMRTVDLSSNFYIGVSTNELRVTDNLFYNGGNTGYRPIRASEFLNGSSTTYKSNVEDLDESGLDILNNLQIKRYVLQSDVDSGLYNNWQVGVISELSPEVATTDGKAVNLYKMLSYSVKAIQELSEEVSNQNKRINDLEMMQ